MFTKLLSPVEFADIEAVCQNYISITPIHCGMTDYDFVEKLKLWAF